jgi:hypothetical protein
VKPVQQKLQIWTGGALNIIKLIGMNSTFAQILGILKRNKMSENLKNFENLKEKKVKIQSCCKNWPGALDPLP